MALNLSVNNTSVPIQGDSEFTGTRDSYFSGARRSVSQKGEIFVRGKSINESSYDFSILALYKNSDHSDARATRPAMKKKCDHVRSPFLV